MKTNTSNTSNDVDMKSNTKSFSSNALTSIATSTQATIHVVHGESNKGLSSARLHIQTPNPNVDQVDASLTTPNHVCCVIDISGSMCGAAKSKDEHGNDAEDIGLSILDIVKFATLVISQSLNAQDKLSIITYSDNAAIALPPTKMTPDGKVIVQTVLKGIAPSFRTNLFAGLKLGVKQAHEVGNEYVNSIFILTDGVPNIHPPHSYERDIAELLAETPVFGSISSFGFGYQLDSKLLVDIATMGGGYYSFIPDAGMVGTCFINALANSRCAYGVHPVLKISGCDFGRLTELGIIKQGEERSITAVTLDECYVATLDDNAIYVELPPLRYGSNVDVMLKPSLLQHNMDGIEMKLIFNTVGGSTVNLDVVNGEGNAAADLFHSTRALFVKDALLMSFDVYHNVSASRNIFSSVAEESAPSNSNLAALYQDMKGQATEAIADEQSFTTWGKHYLLSLSTAHLHQFCNNFKDPGVQVYGTGALFSSLQDSLDDIFEKVPPPVPSRHRGASTSSQTVQMSRVFNNQNAVCVHGGTIVTVKNQSSQKIEGNIDDDNVNSLCTSSSKVTNIAICNIKKGDFILTANGTYVKVDCLVETYVEDKMVQPPFNLIRVGRLRVTPYHPVKLNKQSDWQFPIHITRNKLMLPNDDHHDATAYSVYNLVLESGQRHNAVIMDGIESITLGHGITNNVTLQHSYFGTDKVVSDLERMEGGNGWKSGHIVLRESDVRRDAATGYICHISEMKEEAEEVTIVNNSNLCAPCAA